MSSKIHDPPQKSMAVNEQPIRKWVIQNLFSLAAAALTIANLYLAYRLSPIVSDLRDIGGRVSAVEKRLDTHQQNSAEFSKALGDKLDAIKDGISDIKSRVSRIEGKMEK